MMVSTMECLYAINVAYESSLLACLTWCLHGEIVLMLGQGTLSSGQSKFPVN